MESEFDLDFDELARNTSWHRDEYKKNTKKRKVIDLRRKKRCWIMLLGVP